MNGKWWQSITARRSFLARLGLGAGVVGASFVGSSTAMAQAPAGDASWHPARHTQDDWLDKIPGQHRFVFDTTAPDGISWGLRFANNYFTANQNAYGLKDSDLAVVIVVRHRATSFGYNDAMWAKYGKYFSAQADFVDPKTKEPPTANLYFTVPGDEAGAAGQGGQPVGMDTLIKKGVHFAVCGMSTRAIAGRVAKGTGADADAVVKEIAANLVGNSHLVPAGIVAVNRAQEHGYSFTYAV